MKLRSNFLAALSLVAVSAVPVCAASADWGFEFDRAPALDGAGYLIQPLNNIRAAGNMAIEVGQTLALPGFPTEDGQGQNNGDGTFSYGAEDDGIATASMGIVQDAGAGNATTDTIESPLVGHVNYTMEVRFKAQGVDNPESLDRLRFLDLENNALGSGHFVIAYGRLGGGSLSLSTPTAATFATSTEIPVVQGEFLTMRVVTTSLPGPANTGKVEAFIKVSDTSDWLIGPVLETTWSPTRDRGSLVNVCAEGCGEFGKVTVDYIRGISRSLALTESLNAVGGDPVPGDFDGNGTVDGADKALFDANFGTTLDGGDFLDWQRNFGTSAGASVSASAVPEASAFGLAACCLASLAKRRRSAK